MATIVTYSNPLDPLSRKTEVMEVKYASDIAKHFSYDADVYDLVIARNNEIVETDFEVLEGDIVAVILQPKGGDTVKSIVGIVAAVALAVAAPIAGTALGGTLGIGAEVWTGIVILSGSLLLNAIIPKPVTDSSFETTSQTYGWSESSNLVTQGSALPKVRGTMKVTPPCISKYIETIDDKQYLNALFALNDGHIDSISSIKINGNDVGNYDGVSYEVRYGDNVQAIIGAFDNTRYTQAFTNEINADWDTFTTDGNQVSAVTVGFSFPQGIYSVDTTGEDAGVRGYGFTVYVEYSTDNVNWASAGSARYAGEIQEPVRRTFSIGGLSPNKYYVRVRAVTDGIPGDFTTSSTIYVESLTEEISDDFTYPNTALLSIRALATDQLNGSFPTVTAVISSGSSNPADVVIGILGEAGVTSEYIDTEKFDEWRNYCASKGLACDVYFDSITNVRKAIDIVSACGRARVEQFGSSFSVIADMPNATPVQGFMFTMGNILKDSFAEEFLPIADRANVVEVTYKDAGNDWEQTVLEVSNDTYDNELEENRVSLNFIGCTNRQMAINHANYLLRCNRYLTNTASWDADVDALVCRFGDVVQVAHDVPAWGQSGRLEYGNVDGVRIDRTVSIDEGETYYIKIKYNTDNTVVYKQVSNGVGQHNTLYFTTPLDVAPAEHDLYSFGKVGRETKLMRIISMSTSGGDLRGHLVALEYNEDVYDDYAEINPVLVSDFDISGLRAYDYIRYSASKTVETVLHVNWSGASLSYRLSYKHVDDNAYTTVTTHDNFFSVVAKEGIYTIIVTDDFGNSSEITYNVIGKLAPPDPVNNVFITQQIDTFRLDWGYVSKPIDWSHYEIWYSGGSGWQLERTTETQYIEVLIRQSGEHAYEIYSVDTSGVKSEPVKISATPTVGEVSDLISYYDNNTAYIAWSCDCRIAGMKYEIRKGLDWQNSVIHSIQSDKRVITDSDGTYLIKSFYTTAYGVNVYCEDAQSITIDNSRVFANIIATHDDHGDWLGDKDSTITTITEDNYLTLTADGVVISSCGRYYSAETITLSDAQLCSCSINLEFFANIIGEPFDDISDFDAILNFDNAVYQGYEITPYISISQDGATFSEYKKFYAGDYYGKAFRFAIDLRSLDNRARPIVSRFEYSVDMPDKIDSGYNITTSASTYHVSYIKRFMIVPSLTITPINLGASNCFEITNESENGFDITFYNNCDGLTAITKTFNWMAKGY